MPAPIDNVTYASITQEVVIKEPGIDWHLLNLDLHDPLYGTLDERLTVPYYEKAIEWFLKYYPRYTYQKDQAEASLVNAVYKWILEGYSTEIKNQAYNTVSDKGDKINALTHEQDRLKAMSHFTGQYSVTIEKISALPDRIKYNYHSRLRVYEQACLGANRITTEGLLIVDDCLTKIHLTTNGRKASSDSDSTTNLNEKPKRVNTDAKDKKRRVLEKHDKYILKGYTKNAAIDALVHDFKSEYNPRNPANRRKQIQRIIRNS